MVPKAFRVKKIRIATRASQLALWQAHHIQAKLLALYPSLEIEIIPLKTQGDQLLSSSLAKIGGKGLFVKELEEALLEQRADIAVHSIKDLPAQLPPGLQLAVCCSREAPQDALVSRKGEPLLQLPPNPIIGTSSLRRQAQIKALRSDCDCRLLRGNVPTRIQKLQDGEYDAILLAVAGLDRLKLNHYISQIFTIQEVLPAVGQGALGIECRENDSDILNLLQVLKESELEACIQAERTMNACLGGNCQVPIAGYAYVNDKEMTLIGRVANTLGTVILEACAQGKIESAVALGEQVASQLIAQGARQLIKDSLS